MGAGECGVIIRPCPGITEAGPGCTEAGGWVGAEGGADWGGEVCASRHTAGQRHNKQLRNVIFLSYQPIPDRVSDNCRRSGRKALGGCSIGKGFRETFCGGGDLWVAGGRDVLDLP